MKLSLSRIPGLSSVSAVCVLALSFSTAATAFSASRGLSSGYGYAGRQCHFPSSKTGHLYRRNLQRRVHPVKGTPYDDTGEKGQEPKDRRQFVGTLASTIASVALMGTSSVSAFERTYPLDLDFENGDSSRDLAALRAAKLAREKASKKKSMEYVSQSNPLFFRGPKDFISSFVWGGALWLLSGSRSNPIVTPLANVIYDEKEQPWLKDRNEGLFGPLPSPLLLVLGVVFFFLGIATDRIILFAAEGDANVCLQLAGVSLIGGGALELGRIASGEKKQTRLDFDRETQLEEEFAQFAKSRLIPGGNVHRSEVVKAFRRYFAKYRQAGSTDYPLSDLEIERLLRSWNRNMGNGDMSSAGFFSGIQINEQADVFVNR